MRMLPLSSSEFTSQRSSLVRRGRFGKIQDPRTTSNMASSVISRIAILVACFLLSWSSVEGFAPLAVVPSPSQANTASTQLNMAVAVPTSRSKRRRRWYQEAMPIKQRVVYQDDFDIYDEHGNFRGNAPFRGIQSAPFVLSSKTLGLGPPRQRKRDKVKKAAKWLVRKVRRN